MLNQVFTAGKEKMLKNGKIVKITGGELRGQKIRTPGDGTHPMGERERIALFNMLGDAVKGNRVIDLYCGGMTLGIEAISRGAMYALGIDHSPEAVEVANQNLKKLGVHGLRGGAIHGPLPTVLRTATDRYGIVIADPPYDKYQEKDTKFYARVVLDGGILVLSHPGEAPEIEGMTLEKSRSYAGARISIYRKNK